jgi:hypothetical protein
VNLNAGTIRQVNNNRNPTTRFTKPRMRINRAAKTPWNILIATSLSYDWKTILSGIVYNPD